LLHNSLRHRSLCAPAASARLFEAVEKCGMYREEEEEK
jgi:hypothetical protein